MDVAGHTTSIQLRWVRDTIPPNCVLSRNAPEAEYIDLNYIVMNVVECDDADDQLTYEWSFQPFASAALSSSSASPTTKCDSPPPVWISHAQSLPLTIDAAMSSFVDTVGEYEAVLRGIDRAGNKKYLDFDERDKKRVKISSTSRNPPKNAQFQQTSNGSLLLTWEPPAAAAGVDVVYRYHVEYTIDGGFPEEKTTAVAWSFRRNLKDLFLLLVPGVDDGVPVDVPTHSVLRAHVRTTISGDNGKEILVVDVDSVVVSSYFFFTFKRLVFALRSLENCQHLRYRPRVFSRRLLRMRIKPATILLHQMSQQCALRG